MAWTYDPNLITDTDRVRFLPGDTLEADPLISDEEIGALLALADGVEDAAARAADALVNTFNRKAQEVTDDIGQRVKYGDRAAGYRQLAATLRSSTVVVSAGASVAVRNQAVW